MTDPERGDTLVHLANVFGLCALACAARAFDLAVRVRRIRPTGPGTTAVVVGGRTGIEWP